MSSLQQNHALDMSTLAKKREAYRLLHAQARSLFEAEKDFLANLSQFNALVFHSLPGVSWAGFYIANGEELVLGPFQGKVACVRIPFGKGVCGACAQSGEVQIVPDVNAFPGHIVCDAAAASEMVLPVRLNGNLVGVFDLDSPEIGRFDVADAQGMTALIEILTHSTDWQ